MFRSVFKMVIIELYTKTSSAVDEYEEVIRIFS